MPTKQSMRLSPFILLIPVCILLMICVFIVFLPDYIFEGKVKNAMPMMDQLNNRTLEQIPPPQNATLFTSERSGNLGGQGFGRWLILTYSKNSLTRSDIYQYYLRILSTSKWKIDSGVGSGTSDILAKKGSSCIKIRIFDDSVSKQYEVSIWQDLESIIGSIPENNILFQLSDAPVAHCP